MGSPRAAVLKFLRNANPYVGLLGGSRYGTLSIVHAGRPTSINSAKITHHTISVAKSSQTSGICNCYCDDERRDCPSDSNCSPHGSDNYTHLVLFHQPRRVDYNSISTADFLSSVDQ